MFEGTKTRGISTSGAPTSETSPPGKRGQTCRDISTLTSGLLRHGDGHQTVGTVEKLKVEPQFPEARRPL